MELKDKAIAAALALCAVVAAATAMASPASAAAGNGFKVARFKVEVKGWQTMVQQHTHAALDACDYEDFSSGSEKTTFTSKPIVVTAYYMPGDRNPEFFTGKRLSIPTVAKVKRSYTRRAKDSFPEECGNNGGGVVNLPPPDCGTKTVKPFGVKLGYGVGPRRKDEDTLILNAEYVDDPFEHCQGGSSGFPRLIVFNNKNDYIGAELSQKELFDPQFQKWISIANGSFKEQTPDYWCKVTLHWDVSFTRLKDKTPR